MPENPASTPPEPAAPDPAPNVEETHNRRIVAAESLASELQSQVQSLTRTLEDTREALEESKRRRLIERELSTQGAIDLETTSLLTEAALTGAQDPDIQAAITDLKRRKPFLFRPPAAQRTSAMSGEIAPAPALDDAALEARRTGDRRALLRYLRLRRGC